MCGIFLSLAAAAEVVSLPSGTVKNIEYTNSKAPAYLAFDAAINTNGKYTAGGAWGLAVRLNNNALLASELVNKPFSIKYNKSKLYYIDDNGRLSCSCLEKNQKKSNSDSEGIVYWANNCTFTQPEQCVQV